jgi:serine/threonine protein kinase/tetratricopeptide (TPR) repeat protein
MNAPMTNPPDREVAVFMATVTLAADQRAAYLDQACAGDKALREKIEALLRVHDDVGDFLENPAEAAGGSSATAAAGRSGTMVINPAPVEGVGSLIGRYKLREKIGEGGCGIVYVADQGGPIRRRVALKVIKLGMDTKSVIARFEVERQALAMMDHPNIAKVLDAGATETGRPYFVMELVRGIRITEYCDQNNLSTEERLKLFTQVCQAIQHAHQKGIIHRDIKPSNILVTLHDGVPVPKVIDFGIAKATEGRLSDLTVYTELHQFIGTPAYMSPEQAEMSGLNIDTRSDIYALGVLLYELLTGQTPFDSKELVKSGLDEIRRILREQEPPRPSTRLSTMINTDLTAVAKGHGTQPPKLISLIRGDLDWIVMKCLEKDRTRRYETANGLANDLKRHMNHEPVSACPPSNFYRFQKMVQRNKAAFAAATAVFAALVVGLGVSTWLLVRERRAERETSAALARESILRQNAEAREKVSQAQDLYSGCNFDEAQRLLNTIPPGLVLGDAAQADMERSMGFWFAFHEQWKEAATDFAFLVQGDPGADGSVFTGDGEYYAPALILSGDSEGYEKFRQATISRFRDTTNAGIANRVCYISLLMPADQKTMAGLAPLYDVLVRQQDDPTVTADSKGGGLMALALVDYRRGDYSRAVEHSQLWVKAPHQSPPPEGRIAAGEAILAMAYHQLHREDEARAALTQARHAIEPMFLAAQFVRGHLSVSVAHLLRGVAGQMILNEANALVEGGNPVGDGAYAVARYEVAELYANGSPNYSLYEGVAKDETKAVTWYRKAIDAGSMPAMGGLAWLLSTSTNASLRNGAEAVTLAEKTMKAYPTNAAYLNALAAAYAETGQFEKAVRVQNQTVQFAKTAAARQWYADLLKQYQTNQPYREGN